MRLIADYHTHSRFSRFGHGKDTIEQMVFYANEIGLRELAITDHGFKHFFRTTKEHLTIARKLVDDYNAWSKTKVLLGIEADLLNERGDIDIDDDALDLIDILLVGYHKCIKTDFANFFGKQKKTKSAITKATNAYINCMERYPVAVFTHINADLKLDLYKIGCVCRDKDVYIELNNSHPNWTSSQMEDLLNSGCSFIVNSDAHKSTDIGKADKVMELIKNYKIPASKIINMEFTQEEKTKEELEFDVYYELYKDKLEKEEKKVKYEIDNSPSKLSKEMEDALEKIAGEQGIKDYHRKDGYIDPDKILNDEEYKKEVSEVLDFMENENKQKELLQNSENTNDINLDSQDDTIKTEENQNFSKEQELSNGENLEIDNFEPQGSVTEEIATKNSLENEVQVDSEKAEDLNSETNQNDEIKQEDIAPIYEPDNSLEEQVDMAKDVENEDEKVDNENKDTDIFDTEIDSSKFNVNNHSKSVNGNTLVVVKNENGNAVASITEKTNTKTEKPNQKQAKTRLNNGLVDFSSLKDDD